MAPLQECIAECGVNAPLYTVPSDKHPKPMVVKYVEPEVFGFALRIDGDTHVARVYDEQGKHLAGEMPDIAPVMPKPGERWVTTNGTVLRVGEFLGSLVAWLPEEIRDGTEGYCIDQWGRCRNRDYAEYDLILPYIQPHD